MKVEHIKHQKDVLYLPEGSSIDTYLSEIFSHDTSLVTAVFGLVFYENKVLFTREADEGHPDIDIPGGHVESGESVEDAVMREVYEETGVTITDFHVVGFLEFTVPKQPLDYPYPTPKGYMLFYVAVLKEFQQGSEHAVWLTIDEARQTQWVQNNRALFESIYQEAKYLRGDFERSYLDVYDESGTTVVGTETYDTVHRQGLWHKGVHVFILTPEGKFVIQKRGPEVNLKPNMLESSAGGHINTGHTAIETVIYELHEEIGITVNESEIEYVGQIVDQFVEHDGVWKNNEFDGIYIIRKDIKPEEIIIGKKEVSEVVFVDAKEYLQKGIAEDPSIAHRPEEYKMLYTYLFDNILS